MRFRAIAMLALVTLTAPRSSFAQGTSEAPPSPERVLLNETGIEGRYVNPVSPVAIDGKPLQFVNDTGNRTFVVSIPFVYSTAEATTAYAVATLDRGTSLENAVCAAFGQDRPCKSAERQQLKTLEQLRVLLEAVSKAGKTSLRDSCNTPLKNGSCIVEFFFWNATQGVASKDLLRFAKKADNEGEIEKVVDATKDNFVLSLLGDNSFPNIAEFNQAADRQVKITDSLKPGTPGDLQLEAASSGRASRFDAARIGIARRFLIAALRSQMGFPPPARRPQGTNALSRYMDELLRLPAQEGPGFTLPIQGLLDDLDRQRDEFAKLARKDIDQAYYACRRREVETASKLVRSYSPDAAVPYTGTSVPGLGEGGCDDLKDTAMASLNLPSVQERIQEITREVNAQSLSEQGVEITGCESDGTTTKCSANATIPPYGRATFSSSMLAHHPGARIRFTTSFFGDTEVPGNPNGYVIRIDAKAGDEKPKRSFSLQIGGDTAISIDPDDALAGELRHTLASGALTFQYAGPVEASATVQFKSGDLGGAAANATASQYQAKVYGPHRMVFQYGKIPFAKPSSGIAINVFGEGMQVIAGPLSVGYVVLRESADFKADRDNKDSDLWLFQLRNRPFGSGNGVFRTYDITGLYGNEKKEVAATDETPEQRPYHYWSAGGEVRLGSKRLPSLGGSVAAYYSERKMDSSEPSTDLNGLKDGHGAAGLFRLSWTHIPAASWRAKQEASPAFAFSALLGRGTGDDPDKPGEDEGYLGESAGYSNDMLFLSKVANSPAFTRALGRGLSNKTYLGVQLTSWRFSPLALLAKGIGAEKDIASQSSILTLHGYRFNHEVRGSHTAGEEVDLTFNLEAPKNIQWVLGGAFYRIPSAVEKIIDPDNKLGDELWMISAKLSIKLDNL